MSILIDPPLWPAHGTLFSHVVSDHSLQELHEFARRTGLPQRAFDRDHYDVPERRYRQLVDSGAQPVSGGELVRRLVASGIRVPGRHRPEKLDKILLRRWVRTLEVPGLGRELLAAWSQGHRKYHDRVHLLSVLEALDELMPEDLEQDERQILELTAWFHDAVYRGTAQDEQDSARLAEARLHGLISPGAVGEVRRLVLLTTTHRPQAADYLGQMFSDADLEVLARPPAAYQRYTAAIAEEYSHLPQKDFAAGRSQILQALLDKEQIFATPLGLQRWEASARANLSQEIEQLSRWS
ncbi:DUF4031 domain-containing protein [Glutamicibacter creatinolyticus]|uniref:DUF4031 domain-containing protein n=1 Tax=Glutamicibacter creatinolyticus TaxID=162496 RepID=UPI003216B9C4